MTWPDSVTEQFSLVDLFTTDESDFYGPYNTLLFELFPPNEHYQVSPQFKHIAGSMTRDFTVFYIVSKRKVPVFFVEIQTYLALDKISSRTEADDQMRKKFVEFASGSLPTPKLVGLSALGTNFCVYELTMAENQLLPVRIIPDPQFLIDTAPRARWNYDILDPAGEVKLREVVEEVKAMSVRRSQFVSESIWLAAPIVRYVRILVWLAGEDSAVSSILRTTQDIQTKLAASIRV